MRTKEHFTPLPKCEKSEIDFLTMNQMDESNSELEQLYLEAKEYDFLVGKRPLVLPDFWEQED